MPTYQYECLTCDYRGARYAKMALRHGQTCAQCGQGLRLVITPVAGRVGVSGTPDDFTAEVLGMSRRDLPSGLKT